MNILFISSLYPSGYDSHGVTRALHNIVKYWNSEGNVVVVRPVYIYFREIFTGKVKGFFKPEKIVLDNVTIIVYPVFKIPKIAYFYYPLYRYLEKYFRDTFFKPDIVIAHYDKSLKIGYQYSKRNQLPLVAGLHIAPDLIEENPGKFSRRCGDILKYSSLIACRSGYIHKKIKNWFHRYEEKSFVAYSGIEDELIEVPNDIIERMKNWKTGGKISFISVCTLIERKKIHTNLTALSQLKDKINWTYTIIGDGEERSNLEGLAKQLDIGDQVFFRGKLSRDAVIHELKQSHIFIMVSSLETFGLVYLEAMATGNIVIGARGEGIDGIINDGENGFLAPAGETEHLAIVLKKIVLKLKAKELQDILINSHRTVSFYTEKQASKNYWNHLKEIAGI